MSKKLLNINTHRCVMAIHAPDDWTYWTINGKRVNLRLAKINNSNYPEFTGFILIIGVFSVYFIWRKFKTFIDTSRTGTPPHTTR